MSDYYLLNSKSDKLVSKYDESIGIIKTDLSIDKNPSYKVVIDKKNKKAKFTEPQSSKSN